MYFICQLPIIFFQTNVRLSWSKASPTIAIEMYRKHFNIQEQQYLVFHKMLAAVLILYQKIVFIPNNSKLIESRIADNTKYFLYFENCLGALNSTHLLAHLLATIAPLYRN